MIENKILIVLPCFNEENFVDNALGNLNKILEREDVFLLAIDDGSTDNTMNILKNDNRVDFILKSNQNQGLARVFSSAQNFVIDNKFDFMIIYDCDSQYPTSQIEELIQEAENNDIVIGCRNFKNNDVFSYSKNLLQRIGSASISNIAGLKIKDVTSGFRLFNYHALNKIIITDTFTYTIDSILQSKNLGLKIETIDLKTFNKTRSSRLFKNNFQYLYLTLKTIFNSFLIYKEKSITRFLYLINIFISLIALSRFFIPYFRDGQNPGNVQSLIFGTFLILFTILINMLINQKIQNKKIDSLLSQSKYSNHTLVI